MDRSGLNFVLGFRKNGLVHFLNVNSPTDKNWKGVDETKAQTVLIGPGGEIWVARPDGSITAYD